MIMDRNSTPDYDLSDAADASVSRHHAALGKMGTIRSESPIRHPPLAGPRAPHQSQSPGIRPLRLDRCQKSIGDMNQSIFYLPRPKKRGLGLEF